MARIGGVSKVAQITDVKMDEITHVVIIKHTHPTWPRMEINAHALGN